jgi:hypothetical protein
VERHHQPGRDQLKVQGPRVFGDLDPLTGKATVQQGEGGIGQVDGFSHVGHERFLLAEILPRFGQNEEPNRRLFTRPVPRYNSDMRTVWEGHLVAEFHG